MRHFIEEVQLKNGIRGLLIDVPDASVMTFQFVFRAGSRYTQSKDKYETAHLMEHMAFGANAKFKNEHEYEAEFTKNGAYHNAFTGDISIGYVAECADLEWQRILELQGLAIAEPKFNEEELISEKGNVHSELTGYQNKYGRLLWPKLQQILGEDILLYSQRLKTIEDITLSDIKEHHTRTHTSDNMRFIIAGKLGNRKDQIKKTIESWNLPRGHYFDIPEDSHHKASPVLIQRKDATNLTFGWSSILPRKLTNPEINAADCLNHILTGTMYSKIFGQARRRGLVYDLSSDTSNSPHESSWDFSGEVNYGVADELFQLVVTEIQKILNGDIPQGDVDAARDYALGRYQMGAQTVSQISNYYSGKYFLDGTINDYTLVPDEIKQVSRDLMVDIARSFMASNTWALAAVANGERQNVVKLNNELSVLYDNSQGV